MDLKEIQELIKTMNKSEVAEIKIEREGFKISIRTNGYVANRNAMVSAPMSYSMPVHAAATTQVAAAPAASSENPASTPATGNDQYITIKSPMIGTFYRSAGPDKEMFVKPGDEIQKGSVLCIIEAMKLFNEIESEYAGRIVKILVENATPVEYDQPLFVVEPV